MLETAYVYCLHLTPFYHTNWTDDRQHWTSNYLIHLSL